MSFSYTPPSPEVLQAVKFATYALYAAMIFVPRVWLGATIGSVGSVFLSFFTYGSGELVILEVLVLTPYHLIVGFFFGGLSSLVGFVVRRYFVEFLRADARGNLQDWEG
jgi:hypothetical protein